MSRTGPRYSVASRLRARSSGRSAWSKRKLTRRCDGRSTANPDGSSRSMMTEDRVGSSTKSMRRTRIGDTQSDRAWTHDRLGRIRSRPHAEHGPAILLWHWLGRNRRGDRKCDSRCSRLGQRGSLCESLDLRRQRIASRFQLGSLLLQLGTLTLDPGSVGARLGQACLFVRTSGLGEFQLLLLFPAAAHLFLAAVFFCTARGHSQGEIVARAFGCISRVYSLLLGLGHCRCSTRPVG